jgi:hypothetical protein
MFLGVIFGLQDVQYREIKNSPEQANARLSQSYYPMALKLARPDHTPTLRPLYVRVLNLDGIDDYAVAPDKGSLDLGRGAEKDFTIESFFYVPAGVSGLRTVIEREQFHLKLLFNEGTADGIQLVIHLEKGTLSLAPVINLKTGWHHVAVVFNEEATPGKDITSLYLDGSLEAIRTDPDWGSVLDSSNPIYIGSSSSNTHKGWIEEIRLSSTVRYSSNFTVPDRYFAPDEYTRALWHFDEFLGSSHFADSSGKGNHLTGMNGATIIEPED